MVDLPPDRSFDSGRAVFNAYGRSRNARADFRSFAFGNGGFSSNSITSRLSRSVSLMRWAEFRSDLAGRLAVSLRFMFAIP
jgi:hypothetical protein